MKTGSIIPHTTNTVDYSNNNEGEIKNFIDKYEGLLHLS